MRSFRIVIMTIAALLAPALMAANEGMKVGTLDHQSGSQSMTLIQGARVHTMGSLGTLENADILIVGDTIQAIGTGLDVPQGALVVDAQGKEITPGLMNVSTSLGLVEIGAAKSTVDSSNTEKAYSASLSVADVINSNSSLWAHNRSNGLTHALVKPSNTKALFQGQSSIIKLSDDLNHLVKRDNAQFLTYGDAAAERAGGTRALALQQIREIFVDVAAYKESKEPKKYKPTSGLKLREIEALLPVLEGKQPLVVTAHRANDILAMLKLAGDYNLTMIISGAEEAWLVREQIARAKVALMLNPYNNLPNEFENIDNRIDQMTLLHEAGIPMMITNNASHNAYVIRQMAGNAVAYGLPWDIALASLTRVPAQWFGLDNHYGSLLSGMKANLVIWDGDPLEVTTSAEQVYLDGQAVEMVSRQTRLRDRYLNQDQRRPAYRH